MSNEGVHTLTVRFRDGNLDEMQAYEYICKECTVRNISKNQIVVKAILSIKEGAEYNDLVADIVEGVSRNLLEKGVTLDTTSQSVEEVFEFSEEDLNFFG